MITIKEAAKKSRNIDVYIKLINSKGALSKKTWIICSYDRSFKKYELQNSEDINDFKYVKSETKCELY